MEEGWMRGRGGVEEGWSSSGGVMEEGWRTGGGGGLDYRLFHREGSPLQTSGGRSSCVLFSQYR